MGRGQLVEGHFFPYLLTLFDEMKSRLVLKVACLGQSSLKSKVWVAKVRARTQTCDVRSHVCVCVQNDF